MPTSKIVTFLPLAIIVVATLLVGLGAGFLIGTGDKPGQNTRSINSFEDCAAAGYPIMESYPEQCAVPGGRSFTRQIPQTQSPIDPGDGGMVACTMEAKLCPDGSAVGRSGPKCEFTPCPGE
jgi:hypothetical protein